MSYGRASRLVFISLFCLLSCLFNAQKGSADFVDMQEASNIVENWLIQSKGPISDEMGESIREGVRF